MLGPRSCPEALERCRVGLPGPTGGPDGRRAAERAGEGQGAAVLMYSFRPLWRISTYFCTCRMYVCSIH